MKWMITFESFLDPDILNSLNVKKITHSDYFFSDKKISKFYTNNIFDITVNHMSAEHDVVYLYNTINYRNVEFTILISIDNENNVDYGGEYYDLKNSKYFDVDVFNQLTNEILDDLVPHDIWEIRADNN